MAGKLPFFLMILLQSPKGRPTRRGPPLPTSAPPPYHRIKNQTLKMTSLFKSLPDDMEKIAKVKVVQEGTKIIMGTSTQMGDQPTEQPTDAGVYDVDEDGFLGDEEDMESPLMGMADSVLSDIMSNQVRRILQCMSLFNNSVHTHMNMMPIKPLVVTECWTSNYNGEHSSILFCDYMERAIHQMSHCIPCIGNIHILCNNQKGGHVHSNGFHDISRSNRETCRKDQPNWKSTMERFCNTKLL